jgi:hemolysin activation/secretion protein
MNHINFIRWLLITITMLSSSHLLAVEPPAVTFTIDKIVIEGENPLEQKTINQLLQPYLGQQQGLDGIEAASSSLQQYLVDEGYAFHRVIVPPQKVADGTFKLKVLAFQLDQIEVKGNQYFNKDNIIASLPYLEVGHSLNSREISRSMLLANEHPSKNVTVFIRESEQPGYVNARVEAKDVRPWQLFASLSNTGSDDTGDDRVSLGYQHSNLFDLDHVATLSYTTSPGHGGDVRQYGVYYRLPLYTKNLSLSGFYTYSDVSQGQVADFFDVSGKGEFAGLNLGYTLLPKGAYTHQVTASLEDRYFEDNSQFSGTALGLDVRSRPLSLRYQGKWEKPQWTGDFYVAYSANLGSGSDNDKVAYIINANRLSADKYWDALRFGASLDYRLPKNWRFKLNYSGQWTDEPLISGEQFGLGGVNSVRGFEEREISGDEGHLLRLEAHAPPMKHQVRLLGFVDYGHYDLKEPIIGVDNSQSIASIGVGLRWQWKKSLHTSLDLARVTDGSNNTSAGHSRLHFNLFYRF